MRIAPHRLVLLAALAGLSVPVLAGPQTSTPGVDLDMLDMNGAPFRSFHLGHFSQGLDATSPAAATALPSEELERQGRTSVQEDPERYTGVDTAPEGTLPERPDIAPLLGDYDERLLQPSNRD